MISRSTTSSNLSNNNFDSQVLELLSINKNDNGRKEVKDKNTPNFMTYGSIDEIEDILKTSRPTKAKDVSNMVMSFNKFVTCDNSKDMVNFFYDNKMDISIEAHILNNEENDIVSILDVSSVIVRLFGEGCTLKNLNTDDRRIVLLSKLLNLCRSKLDNLPFAQLPIDNVTTLFFNIKKQNAGFIDNKLVELLKEKVMLSVDYTTSIQFLFSILNWIQLTPNQCRTIFNKAKELLPNLSINDSAALMYHISLTKQRPLPLLQEIVQHMEFKSNESISCNNLVKLTESLRLLSFHNIHITRLICKNFQNNISAFQNPNHIAIILYSLSIMNCGNENVWRIGKEWLNKNYTTLSLKNGTNMVIAFSKFNIPSEDIKIPLNYFCNNIHLKKASNSRTWLYYVHGMTILDHLTPRLAESVLKDEFITDLLENKEEPLKLSLLNTIGQINCYAKEYLKKNYKIGNLYEKYVNIKKDLEKEILLILYDKREQKFISSADKGIRRIVGTDKKCSGPRIINGGIFVNNIIQYSNEGEIEIVEDWDKVINNKNIPKIGFMYISNRQMIRNVDTGVLVKENGSVALRIKLLEKVGFKVINIYEHELEKRTTALENVNYIKDEMKKYVNI
uniref:RAP domain-containing protein n=1 Tax=Parastrongyloides trichosuri TaxID=131310 RepID=A0A0N5A2K9_PARTI